MFKEWSIKVGAYVCHTCVFDKGLDLFLKAKSSVYEDKKNEKRQDEVFELVKHAMRLVAVSFYQRESLDVEVKALEVTEQIDDLYKD